MVRRRQCGDDLSEAVYVLQDWKRKQLLVLEVTRVCKLIEVIHRIEICDVVSHSLAEIE